MQTCQKHQLQMVRKIVELLKALLYEPTLPATCHATERSYRKGSQKNSTQAILSFHNILLEGEK